MTQILLLSNRDFQIIRTKLIKGMLKKTHKRQSVILKCGESHNRFKVINIWDRIIVREIQGRLDSKV